MAPFIRTSCARGAFARKRAHSNYIAGAITVLAFGVAGCSDSDLKTDLDSEGPPEILVVTVTSEADETNIPVLGHGVPDVATFCASEGRVNELMCGDGVRTVSDAPPLGWSVRVAFSELLDPDAVEDLVDTDNDGTPDIGTIAEKAPVTLTCGGNAVDYDGFYDPSGNAFTYPPGPSLVVITEEFVQTGTSDCALTLDTKVVDKDGNAPTAAMGPYTFGIATMKITGNDPANDATGVDPTTAVPLITFNAPVDATTAAQVTVNDGTNDIVVNAMASDADPTALMFVPEGGALAENTTYTVTVPSTVGITDSLGGALEIAEDYVYTFTTGTAP